MANPSSSKKVQRAARAASASKSVRERREIVFPLALAMVVILGVALVVFARSSRAPASAPRVGNDHWHSAYAIFDCDRFLPAFTSAADPDGIHSHQDGVVHVHPWNSSAAGEQADSWLARAAAVPAEPGWVCATCGAHRASWTAVCPSCHSFDSYDWQPSGVPGGAGGLAGAGRQPLALMEPAAPPAPDA